MFRELVRLRRCMSHDGGPAIIQRCKTSKCYSRPTSPLRCIHVYVGSSWTSHVKGNAGSLRVLTKHPTDVMSLALMIPSGRSRREHPVLSAPTWQVPGLVPACSKLVQLLLRRALKRTSREALWRTRPSWDPTHRLNHLLSLVSMRWTGRCLSAIVQSLLLQLLFLADLEATG